MHFILVLLTLHIVLFFHLKTIVFKAKSQLKANIMKQHNKTKEELDKEINKIGVNLLAPG